jgi:molybdopterin synthase sulfur carrier subunit
MIRVHLPFHLRNLAGVTGELQLEVAEPVTQRSVLDAVEAKFPQLRGTIRDHDSPKRRAFVRFFYCQEDHSNDDPDALLPQQITSGEDVFLVIGALAGG